MAADTIALPNDLRRLVDNELDKGERLVWLDQPLPGLFAKRYVPIMLFGIPFGGFAVFWTAMAYGIGNVDEPAEGIGTLFPLFGLPFMAVGFGMLFSPFYGRWQARRTVYALTDRRVILFERNWNGVSIRSFTPQQLGNVERNQRVDGSGDLIFAREFIDNAGNNGPSLNKIGFRGIRNVKQVEDQVEAMVAESF